ncbi:hypothetical protein M413DRAFT_448417 [Hebeloma cylindrosporum]|uniref:NACHT domain-containing protein n=1 Tax=Hebeloma cylindrosporum TaxID=76867 RepID=A0A0C3C045_HEBCY|nr:hypothetical protein M413DRAFT_448417 [Hebeloma cylindrosporum h7]
MFSNAHNLVITGGNFNHFASPEEVADLNFFQDYVALGALHNSGERFDPPKCHPNTRVSILQKIMEWIKSSEKIDELILWIYGAAGAGKSAIAQTVAEMCEKEGILLGSFFFSRTSPGRSDGNRLIPTLAYQMAVNLPKTRSHIKRAFQMNPFIFSQNMESQRDILISQPLKKAISRLPGSSSRQALIIDGLDECSDPKVHSQLLTVLVSLAKEHPSLRILITSRPEHHILSFFNSQLEHAAFRIALNDSQFETDDDVRMFLCSKFAEIVRSHPLKDHIPPSWPSISALETIVSKASGQFIHASTVIKYIDSPRHNPMDRLNVILQLSPSDAHSAGPYEELDSMYRYILASVENVARTKSILGLTLLTSDFLIGFKEFAVNCVVDLSALHGTLRSIPGIAQILDISEEDVLLSLTELASVLQVEFVSVVQYSQDGHPDSEYFQEGIKFLHASFDDFLKDPTRSKHFYISMGALHHLAAKGCLRILARIARSPTSPNPPCSDPVVEYAVHALMIHFWKATLTKGLLDDLEKFDFRSWLVCNIRWYSRHFPPCEDWEDGASAKSTAINLALFFRRLRSLVCGMISRSTMFRRVYLFIGRTCQRYTEVTSCDPRGAIASVPPRSPSHRPSFFIWGLDFPL